MATKTAPAAEAATDKAAAKGGGKKKLVVVAALLVVLAGAWYMLLGPGSGKSAEPAEPVPGEVLSLEPITMNLADGRLLKVGLALQMSAEAGGHGEPNGATALDEAISFLGEHTYDQLAAPGGRDAAKAELSHRVAERYHGDVLEVLFTQFVMQ